MGYTTNDQQWSMIFEAVQKLGIIRINSNKTGLIRKNTINHRFWEYRIFKQTQVLVAETTVVTVSTIKIGTDRRTSIFFLHAKQANSAVQSQKFKGLTTNDFLEKEISLWIPSTSTTPLLVQWHGNRSSDQLGQMEKGHPRSQSPIYSLVINHCNGTSPI